MTTRVAALLLLSASAGCLDIADLGTVPSSQATGGAEGGELSSTGLATTGDTTPTHDGTGESSTGNDPATGSGPSGSTDADSQGVLTTGPGDGDSTGGGSDTSLETSSGADTFGDMETDGGLAPVADDDVFYTSQDTALLLGSADGVLSNDLDPEAGLVGVTDFDATSANGGAVTVALDGALYYQPASGFWGTDTFVYVVSDAFGGTATATVTIYVAPVLLSVTDLDPGVGGLVLRGVASSDGMYHVDGVGDINGDGLDDVVTGSTWHNDNGTYPYRAYVTHGRVAAGVVDLGGFADGAGGFVIDDHEPPVSSMYRYRYPAGDVNGDGLNDIVLTMWDSWVPRSYVVFGKADTESIEASEVGDTAGGFEITHSGSSVTGTFRGAGDVNGDGLDDIIVGKGSFAVAGESHAGRSWIVFGKSNQMPVDLPNIEQGVGGFTIDGEAVQYQSGTSVSGAGDVNGDGLADVVIGGPGEPESLNGFDPDGLSAGRSYVVFGKSTTEPVQLAAIAAGAGGFAVEGEEIGDRSGEIVRGGGDVNGDGLDDVLIFAGGAGDGGRVYVVFGRTDTATVALGDLGAGIGGFVISGEAGDSMRTTAVDNAGDVNGDGLADVLIAANRADVGNTLAGRAYVAYGTAGTTGIALESVAAGLGGFAVDGADWGDHVGRSISGAGDVNGDGLADVAIGTGADTQAAGSGTVFVVFGVPTGSEM